MGVSGATVCLKKDEDDFERAIQNMEVRPVETIFETVEVQISNLKNRDHEIQGLEEKGELDKWSLEKLSAAGSQDCCSIRLKSVRNQ